MTRRNIRVDFSREIMPRALLPMMSQNRWIVWKFEDDRKIPFNAKTHKRTDYNKPENWVSFDEARETKGYEGVGFCLIGSEFGAFDLDNCIERGQLSDSARDLLRRANTYAEITPSGKGLRIIGRASGDPVHNSLKGDLRGEVWRDCEQYFTVTGRQWENTPSRLSNIDALIDEYARVNEDTRASVELPARLPTIDIDQLSPAAQRALMQCKDIPDRSNRLTYVTRALVRDKYEPAQIASVLTLKGHPVSEHFTKNEYRRTGLVTRQLKRVIGKVLDEIHPPDRDHRSMWGAKSLDKIKRVDPECLWYPYLIRGEVTILDGDPEGGKSWLLMAMATKACDGRMKDLPSPRRRLSSPGQMRVLAFDADNSISSITRARLEWLGCRHMENYLQKEEAFSIDSNFTKTMDLIDNARADIVIFDMVNYYLTGDTTKPDIAATLQRFKQLARECNCAVVLVRWLTKGAKVEKAMYRGQGNIAFAGLGAVQMVVGFMDDADDEHRYFGVVKCRIDRKPRPHDFYVESCPTVSDPYKCRFQWGDYLEEDVENLVKAPTPSKNTGAREEAKKWLCDELNGHPVEVKTLMEKAENRQFSYRTLLRAADELGVFKNEKRDRFGHHTSFWRLESPKTSIKPAVAK